ncbi:MAG: hypothetical protein AB7F86_10240 [Bdellovibrionales bacterium]
MKYGWIWLLELIFDGLNGLVTLLLAPFGLAVALMFVGATFLLRAKLKLIDRIYEQRWQPEQSQGA